MPANTQAFNLTDLLSDILPHLENGNIRILYVFAALILGIIIRGIMKNVAKLILGAVILSGLTTLILMLMQKQDILSTVASIVFGIIMLVYFKSYFCSIKLSKMIIFSI